MIESAAERANLQLKLIRRCLFWLLFKVVGVMALTALLLGLLTIMLRDPRNEEASFPREQLAILKMYYLAQGSWDGVAALCHVPDDGRINIAVQPARNGVALSVADSGAGVPESDLPFLFDRFWRAEKSRNRASGGAGLGVAIVNQLVGE